MTRSPLLSCEGVGHTHGTRSLFERLSFGLFEGDQVGVVGPNGAGKSTLLRILAGIERPNGSGKTTLSVLAGTDAPDADLIERAEGLRTVRFEQRRGGLDPGQSLRRALAPEGDAVHFQGRTLHVAAWAKRFLFPPEQLEMPVGRLSGGSGIWSSGSGTGWRRRSCRRRPKSRRAGGRRRTPPSRPIPPRCRRALRRPRRRCSAHVDRLYARWAELEARGDRR